MIQISPGASVFIAKQPINFRFGIDRIAGYCRDVLHAEPMDGAYFLFRNTKNTAIRLLVYDGDGFWLCTKRFSKGKTSAWPKSEASMHKIDPRDLLVLFWRGNLSEIAFPKYWKKLT